MHKPIGMTSHDVVAMIKRTLIQSSLVQSSNSGPSGRRNRRKRDMLKVGHGGTLDPLAEGAIVIGVGSGTKKLSEYLGQCEKVYTAEALLGARTTTYDSEGEVIEYGLKKPSTLTDAEVDAVIPKFRGEISQFPPVFSALKIDGKPLYAYAREQIPLPRPIEKRDCVVSYIDYGKLDFTERVLPSPVADEKTREFSEHVLRTKLLPPPETQPPFTGVSLSLTLQVSSGTYIRSLINDIGEELGTKGHMSKLVRNKQGKWEIGKNVLPLKLFEKGEDFWWPVLEPILKEGPDLVLDPEVLNGQTENKATETKETETETETKKAEADETKGAEEAEPAEPKEDK